MAYKPEQLEKGSLRQYLKPGEKRKAKKAKTRVMRRISKNIDKENLLNNRYLGWRLYKWD